MSCRSWADWLALQVNGVVEESKTTESCYVRLPDGGQVRISGHHVDGGSALSVSPCSNGPDLRTDAAERMRTRLRKAIVAARLGLRTYPQVHRHVAESGQSLNVLAGF